MSPKPSPIGRAGAFAPLLIFVLLFAALSVLVPDFFGIRNMRGLILSVTLVGTIATTMMPRPRTARGRPVGRIDHRPVGGRVRGDDQQQRQRRARRRRGARRGTVRRPRQRDDRRQIEGQFADRHARDDGDRARPRLPCIGRRSRFDPRRALRTSWGPAPSSASTTRSGSCSSASRCSGSSSTAPSSGATSSAIGGNPEAARLAGVPVDRVRITVFALQGLIAGLAGIVLAARITSGQPNTSLGLELAVISACVLGGVSLAGGIGTITGVIIGVFIMGAAQNALNLLDVPTFYQYVVRGGILLAAVIFDRLRQTGRLGLPAFVRPARTPSLTKETTTA